MHLKPSPINGAALNLAVGVFGVSILAMPSAFLGVGVVAGVAIITAVGVLTIVSITFLAVAMEALELYSYEGLSKRLLGPWSVRAARWMLFLFNFGDCVSYLIVSGRLLEPLHAMLVKFLGSCDSQVAVWAAEKLDRVDNPAVLWTCVYWATVLLPLSFVRRVTMLQRLSGLAVCALLYIVGAVVYRYWVPLEGGLKITPVFNEPLPLMEALSLIVEDGGRVFNTSGASPAVSSYQPDQAALLSTLTSHIIRGFLSIPIIMFAFDCQALIFQLYTSLEQTHRSVESMVKVTVRAIVAAWAVYIVIGVFGYLTFGDATPDNILRAYNPKHDPVFAVAYVMFLVPATVAFALVLFPVRDVVFEALEDAGLVAPTARLRCVVDDEDDDTASLERVDVAAVGGSLNNDEGSTDVDSDNDGVSAERTFRIVSAVLSFGCLVTAIVAPRLDIVFGLLGGLCSSGLCFLFPAAYRIRLAVEELVPLVGDRTRRLAWGMVVVGVFGAIYGTAAGVLEFIQQ